MKNICIYTAALIYFFTIATIAQQGTEDNSNQKSNSIDIEAMRDSSTQKLLRRLKHTPEIIERLKNMGIDLQGYLFKNAIGTLERDERCQAGVSDLVFIGKVINIVDLPNPDNYPFHSIVNVQIVELLRGRQQITDTIKLMRGSGTITDGNQSANKIIKTKKISSRDANFKIGEVAVFFANNIVDHPYLTVAFKSTFHRALQTLPSPCYFVSNSEKFPIKDSIVYYYKNNIPLSQFRIEIKQVAKVVD